MATPSAGVVSVREPESTSPPDDPLTLAASAVATPVPGVIFWSLDPSEIRRSFALAPLVAVEFIVSVEEPPEAVTTPDPSIERPEPILMPPSVEAEAVGSE